MRHTFKGSILKEATFFLHLTSIFYVVQYIILTIYLFLISL